MATDAIFTEYNGADQPRGKRCGRRAGMADHRAAPADFGAISGGRGSSDADGLTHVAHDTYLLIDHLSGRNDCSVASLELDCPETGAKVNLIDKVCGILWSTAGRTDVPKQAAALFKARDKLSVLAAPATCLTIAYTLLVAPGGNGKADFARAAYPNLVEHANRFRRWISWLLICMIAVVVITSLLSWYVAYGRLVLLRIEQLDGQRSEIAAALDTAEGAVSAVGQASNTRGTPSEAWQQDEHNLLDRCDPRTELQQNARSKRACAAAEHLNKRRMAADYALYEWTSYWLWLPHSAALLQGADLSEGAGTAQVDEREEQWSANLLAILGNYVLPMMYGFLGAAAAVMLNVNQKIRSCRLKPRDCRMSLVQLVLGVITGACIGLFLTPCGAGAAGTPLGGGSVALSASALSFLAGFGVEGVFKMIQNILTTVFGDQPHAQAPASHS